MLIDVHHHASVIIVYNSDILLSNIYDNTYPRESCRGRINLLGGSQNRSDKSPKDLLERELGEEFRICVEDPGAYDKDYAGTVGAGSGAPKVEKFATQKDIELVKSEILSKACPYQDFLAHIPQFKNLPGHNVMYSVYAAESSPQVLECVQRNLSLERSLVSEGFLRLSHLEELTSGRVLTAWISGLILEDFFKRNMPNPDGFSAERIGMPRPSLQDYFSEFNYFIHP